MRVRRTAGRRISIAVVVVLGAVSLAGCQTKNVAQQNPCPAAGRLGAPQLPRIGLTARVLKAQQKCS
jgi:hypothetical protein